MPLSIQALRHARSSSSSTSRASPTMRQYPAERLLLGQRGGRRLERSGLRQRLYARRRLAAMTATTPARCPASASISTSSRSPRSAARSTSTSTTSRASRRSPVRKARSTARARKRARSASSPTSRTQRLLGRLRRRGQQRRPWRHRRRRSRAIVNIPISRQRGDPPRRLGRARRRLHRQRRGHRHGRRHRRRRAHLSGRQHRGHQRAVPARTTTTTPTSIGGRAALKIDLDDNWTITPTIMGQKTQSARLFAYDPAVGDLEGRQVPPGILATTAGTRRR